MGTIMGIGVGKMQEAAVDEKGRIVIPRKLRNAVGLVKGSKVKLHSEGRRIVVEKAVSPEKFSREMKGFIKKGSKVRIEDPLKLKEIWK